MPAPGQLMAHRFGDGLDGVLRRRVRCREGTRHPAADRPHEHDAAVRCLPDQREHRLGDGDLADDIDLELAPPVLSEMYSTGPPSPMPALLTSARRPRPPSLAAISLAAASTDATSATSMSTHRSRP